MLKKENIITRYLNHRWYKRVLVITDSDISYLYKINALKLIVCSGYLKVKLPLGCVFDIDAWPFECKFFDLIILDESFVSSTNHMKALFNQLHFCLADDGELVVANSKGVRIYNLLSHFVTHGFIIKKVRLINYSSNLLLNMVRRIISRQYVVVFKKDNYFSTSTISVGELINEPIRAKVYSGGCARNMYGSQEK
ncbi:MAG: class I SAM-dependent methyltransferase [Francisella sp.]